MFNSIILMFSQYATKSKSSFFFKVGWVLYAILMSFFNNNLWFSVINMIIFFILTSCITLLSKINPKVNEIMSVCSVMIYSLLVDIACYYLLSGYSAQQSLKHYIINGLLFNCKSLFLNIAVFMGVAFYLKLCEKFKSCIREACSGALNL